MKQNLLTLVASLMIGASGCKTEADCKDLYASPYRREDPVDQIFRDHDGYRVYFTEADGLVRETKYFDHIHCAPTPTIIDWSNEWSPRDFKRTPSCDEAVSIFKDLPAGTRGFAKIMTVTGTYDNYVGLNRCEGTGQFVEIHLPKEATLSPGHATYGGKYQTHEPMGEVR